MDLRNVLPRLEDFTIQDLIPLAKVMFVILSAMVLVWVSRRLIGVLRFRLLRLMKPRSGADKIELEKRATTVSGALKTLIAVFIWIGAIGVCLKQLGLDVAPLMTGAGAAAGIAIGLGGQNLARDVMNGIFVLLEDQIRVNDVAIINGVSGVVEELNLRTTVLRDAEGVVHVFPNGAITALANRTRVYSCYVLNFGVAFDSDVDKAIKALKDIDLEMRADATFGPMMLEPVEVWGVDQFLDTGVVVKARLKTVAGKQWDVGREMNRRIRNEFRERGIALMARWPQILASEDPQPGTEGTVTGAAQVQESPRA
ncbi:MAG TPA: mechanosensitive ion channel family protein [Bryobacteraceae bacterium]|nr:mechanosensitive ion channel family protein [Bryobacteraceae bacterium]